jgi:EpsI family protein
MSRRSLLVATLVALLLPGALLLHWSRSAQIRVDFGELTVFPTEVGPWRATGHRRLEDEVLTLIEPDVYLMQRYEAVGRAPIWLYLGVYGGRSGYGKGAHDPEVCYPAQGWEILRSESFELPLGEVAALRTKRLEAHRGSAKEAVLYWFQPADRWPVDEAGEQLLRVWDAMRRRPQYAFVRISAPTDGGEAAARDLAEFAERIAEPVRDFVEDGVVAESTEAPGGRRS